MANNIGWGQGANNNSIGWGNVGTNGFGSVYETSSSGDTALAGQASVFEDAAVAYSLRDLGLGATNVVRVRRSTDNTEQDFTASQITDGTLTSFCGVGDGFVSVWYDQKFDFDFSVSTANKQPRIVLSGSLELLNNKPILKSYNTATGMLSSYIPNKVNSNQLFLVGVNNGKSEVIFGSETSTGDFLYLQQSGNGQQPNSSVIVTNERLNGSAWNRGTRAQTYIDLQTHYLISNKTKFEFIDNTLALGYRFTGNLNISMNSMQEIIIMNTDIDVLEAEANINNYYGIY